MPGIERQILYDLTQKWDLINKTNERTKKNQRRGNKEQTDNDLGGGVIGRMGKEGEGSRNLYKGPMDKDTRGGED